MRTKPREDILKDRQTYLYEVVVSPDTRDRQRVQRQTEWLLYRVRGSFIQRGGGALSVCVCVRHLNDYACMYAVGITECLSIQYKNNCESVCANVKICVCVCVCVVRAGGHRRIKRRQKDEHLAGLGRTEG